MFHPGQAAGDAPENKGLVAQIQQLKASNGISLYIDFHSYGQYILWGKSCNPTANSPVQPFPSARVWKIIC